MKFVAGALMAVIVVDFLYNAAKMYVDRKMHVRWRIDVKQLYLYRKIHELKKGHV